jgi:hypothetical protein
MCVEGDGLVGKDEFVMLACDAMNEMRLSIHICMSSKWIMNEARFSW